MKFTAWLSASMAGAMLAGMTLVAALPVDAATAGPNVVAVHRNGAVDVPGGAFGTVAKMSVPAGNWSITATGTLLGTDAVDAACNLVAGTDSYDSQADPTAQGVGSYTAIVLLLAHHFNKTGSVTLACWNSGLTGDALVRDVHITAIQVGQLTDPAGTFGTGSPRAYYGHDTSTRFYSNLANFDVQDIALPAGTWLVQAVAWGRSNASGDRVDCSIASSLTTADQFAEQFQGSARALSLEGVLTLSAPDHAFLYCKDSNANWLVLSSAISAIKVGTLKYGPIGGSLSTTGSGSPVVVGAFSDNAGAVAASASLRSIGNVSLGAGSWFVTSELSLFAGAVAKTTCQLRLSGGIDQGRVILDAGTNFINWLGMSLTRKLSASSTASIACDQSAGASQVLYLHDKIFAIKAGTLSDTLLE